MIEELDSFSTSPRNAMLSMEMASGKSKGGAIAPGLETVRARVKALFRIAP
jgi:hypothetical protein